MRELWNRAVAGSFLAGAMAGGGCVPYHRAVDPCYPERYNTTARKEVVAAFAPQVQNGHVLDQTIWNYFFDAGKADLNASGRDQLDALVRRRPMPDPRIYLQTARDIGYDAANPDRTGEDRANLDKAREETLKRYLASQTAGRPQPFEIVVHDPIEVYQNAAAMNRSIQLNQQSTSGSLTGGASATTAGQGSTGGSGSAVGAPQGQGGQGGGGQGGGGR